MWLLDLFGDSNPVWSKTASFHGQYSSKKSGGTKASVGSFP